MYGTQRCRLGDGPREAGSRYAQVPGHHGQSQPRSLVGRLGAKNSSRLLMGVTALARAGAPERCPFFSQPATAASTPGRGPCYVAGLAAAIALLDGRWLRSDGRVAAARRQVRRPRRRQHECCHGHGDQLLRAAGHGSAAVTKGSELMRCTCRHWRSQRVCCGCPVRAAALSRLSART